MDIAWAIDKLVPAAIYSGSTSANTQAAYTALTWGDERTKPTWTALVAAFNANPIPTDKKAAIKAALETLSVAQLTVLAPALGQGAPMMDAGRWDVVAALADEVQSDDAVIQNVVQSVKAIAEGS